MTYWFKSSYSTGENTDCVETARFPKGHVGIRDSKNPEGGHLNVSPEAFRGLLARVKAGDLSL